MQHYRLVGKIVYLLSKATTLLFYKENHKYQKNIPPYFGPNLNIYLSLFPSFIRSFRYCDKDMQPLIQLFHLHAASQLFPSFFSRTSYHQSHGLSLFFFLLFFHGSFPSAFHLGSKLYYYPMFPTIALLLFTFTAVFLKRVDCPFNTHSLLLIYLLIGDVCQQAPV